MVKTLPARFNPDLMERDGTRYEVTAPIRLFPRLRGILASDDGEVRAGVSFSRRKDLIVAAGRLAARWPLECQRCLEPMAVDVDAAFELVLVDSEAAARALPKELDPVILDDGGQIAVVDLLEDELLLHVPSFPRHEGQSRCEGGVRSFGAGADRGEARDGGEDGRPNPFAVLKNLDIH